MSFVCCGKLVSFEPQHVTCSSAIGKKFELGGYDKMRSQLCQCKKLAHMYVPGTLMPYNIQQ